MERAKLPELPKSRPISNYHAPFPWRRGEDGCLYSADGRKLLLTGVAFPLSDNGKFREAQDNGRLLVKAQYVDRLIHILEQFIGDLPMNRDWLDPSLESEARGILDEVHSQEKIITEITKVLGQCWCRDAGCDCVKCQTKREDKIVCCDCHD